MAREKTPTWQRKRVYLPPSGPEAVGTLPDATAPPTRPVTRRAAEGTNASTLARPAQGQWIAGQDMSIPTPSPESTGPDPTGD